MFSELAGNYCSGSCFDANDGAITILCWQALLISPMVSVIWWNCWYTLVLAWPSIYSILRYESWYTAGVLNRWALTPGGGLEQTRCITSGGMVPHQPCAFPFKSRGVIYDGCTNRSAPGRQSGALWFSWPLTKMGLVWEESGASALQPAA